MHLTNEGRTNMAKNRGGELARAEAQRIKRNRPRKSSARALRAPLTAKILRQTKAGVGEHGQILTRILERVTDPAEVMDEV
jgi:hypothetical protein